MESNGEKVTDLEKVVLIGLRGFVDYVEMDSLSHHYSFYDCVSRLNLVPRGYGSCGVAYKLAVL
jgi:hypothetical protein